MSLDQRHDRLVEVHVRGRRARTTLAIIDVPSVRIVLLVYQCLVGQQETLRPQRVDLVIWCPTNSASQSNDAYRQTGEPSSLVCHPPMLIAQLPTPQGRRSTDSFEHVPRHTCGPERKARLIYCKSHVAIHPTQLRRDNISGLLGLVEVDKGVTRVPESSGSNSTSGKEVLVVWVPDELFMRMSEEDQRNYKRVEDRSTRAAAEEDGKQF